MKKKYSNVFVHRLAYSVNSVLIACQWYNAYSLKFHFIAFSFAYSIRFNVLLLFDFIIIIFVIVFANEWLISISYSTVRVAASVIAKDNASNTKYMQKLHSLISSRSEKEREKKNSWSFLPVHSPVFYVLVSLSFFVFSTHTENGHWHGVSLNAILCRFLVTCFFVFFFLHRHYAFYLLTSWRRKEC